MEKKEIYNIVGRSLIKFLYTSWNAALCIRRSYNISDVIYKVTPQSIV